MFEHRDLVGAVQALVSALEPERLIPDQAAAFLEEMALLGRLADAAVTRLASKASQSHAWRRKHPDAGTWLGEAMGISPYDARQLLTASAHLERELGPTWDAMASGELPASKGASALASRETARAHRAEQERKAAEAAAAALLDGDVDLPDDLFDDLDDESERVVLSSGPTPEEAEAAMLDKARNGGSLRDLRDEARRQANAAADAKQLARHQHRDRHLRPRTYEDGSIGGFYKLPPAVGALLNSLLKDEGERLAALGRKAGRSDSYGASMADALCRLLGIDPPTDPDAPADHEAAAPRPTRGTRRPKASRPASKPSVKPVVEEPEPARIEPKGIVRLDLEATLRGTLAPGDVCDLYGHGALPLADAVALAHTGQAYLVVHHDGRTLHVTRLGRRRPPDLPPHLLPTGPATGFRATAILRVDAATIAATRLATTCHLAGVGPVSAQRLTQLLGETWSAAAEANPIDVRTVIYDSRSFPDLLWIAAFDQAPYCRHCHKTGHLEADHERAVALGGLTTLENLGLLCPYDHQTKTLAEAARTIPAGIRAARQRAAAGTWASVASTSSTRVAQRGGDASQT